LSNEIFKIYINKFIMSLKGYHTDYRTVTYNSSNYEVEIMNTLFIIPWIILGFLIIWYVYCTNKVNTTKEKYPFSRDLLSENDTTKIVHIIQKSLSIVRIIFLFVPFLIITLFFTDLEPRFIIEFSFWCIPAFFIIQMTYKCVYLLSDDLDKRST
jgi:hypothetical protein